MSMKREGDCSRIPHFHSLTGDQAMVLHFITQFGLDLKSIMPKIIIKLASKKTILTDREIQEPSISVMTRLAG